MSSCYQCAIEQFTALCIFSNERKWHGKNDTLALSSFVIMEDFAFYLHITIYYTYDETR